MTHSLMETWVWYLFCGFKAALTDDFCLFLENITQLFQNDLENYQSLLYTWKIIENGIYQKNNLVFFTRIRPLIQVL